jgi:very-short-patch-repair endonuclease
MRTPPPWALPTQPIARADLLARGVTARMLRTRLANGDLVLVRTGVYLRADAWPANDHDRHVLSTQAELTVHSTAVASHRSAALVHGLPTPGFERWEDGPVSVTLPRTGKSVRTAWAIHHTGPLPAGQVQHDAQGYPLTSPARTAVDLAADLPLPEALVLLDGAARLICASLVTEVRRRDYMNPQLARVARDLLEESASTIRAARLTPAIRLTDPARESVAESLSAGHMRLAGLTEPRYQAQIRTSIGLVYPDFLWEDLMLIGEVDGAVKYERADAYVLEKEREQALRDRGYRIVRWLAKEIMLHPEVVMARLARAMES